MERVEHGGDIYNYNQQLLDFSSNINPLGIPTSAKEILEGSWDYLTRYPDIEYTGLRKAIAKEQGTKSEEIIVGNGAAEIIYLLGQLFEGKRVLIPQPTFGEYQQAVINAGGEVIDVYRNEENDFTLPVNKIVEQLSWVDGLILCHPNNPTGDLISEEDLKNILDKAREEGVKVILDEAFIDFVPTGQRRSGLKWLDSHPQLFIIRAYTKFFAMPGLRLGYGLGSTRLIEKLKKKQMPWSVNSLAVEVGQQVLGDREYIDKSQQWIAREREFLLDKLDTIVQLKVYPTEANFILCKIKNERLTAVTLKKLMVKKGILIRDASTFIGLDNFYFRVAIKERESNIQLYQTLKQVLSDG